MPIARILFTLPLPEPFDYTVPDGMALEPGSYVAAPVGPYDRLGMVVEVLPDQPGTNRKLKAVSAVYDVPPMSAPMREFLTWATRYTVSHPGTILSMALRAREALVPSPVELRYRLGGPPEGRLTPARAKVLEQAALLGLASSADLAVAAGVSSSVVKGLLSMGALEEVEELVDLPFPAPDPDLPGAVLTGEQASAAEELREGLQKGGFSAYLLDGVTGSGKTEVYFEAIAEVLRSVPEAQILVLLPEIALTQAILSRFEARFGAAPAPWHSGLNPKERRRTMREVLHGRARIVIGARSALFLPFRKLKLIIVDEEHDGSYKQTPPVPPPYYHAREAAIALAQFTGAVIILGSATPDVVTYHRAQGGRYHLLELPRRIMGHRQRIMGQAERLNLTARYQPVALPATDVASREDILDLDDALTIPLPPIQVVDMRQELRAGNRTIFSRALDSAIGETLERNEQAILFLNRRGSATFVNCRNCGHVMKCPRCGTPLTYHRAQLMLVCHQCGRREPNPQTCPNCRSDRIRFFGLGTERLVELVGERWPEARIIRWDRDTTSEQGSHEALLAGFINHEADILVGTQMIAKGLDLPFVTLVGVISADVSLNLPDYNTGERAFQVLAQVAGRAGRGLLGGRVIMQTYQPHHYAIQAAADHDYPGFYVEEMEFRTQRALPPFRRIARLLVADPVEDKARRMAEAMAGQLRQNVREQALAATDIMGPTPAFFSRLDGRYRWHILIHSPDPYRVLAGISFPRSWVIDIDPESTL
jgi:primosomal protein N' (replication factor Y) (superfamily II helicase)